MKSHVRNHVAALFMLMPAAATLVALPGTAMAQPATPDVRSLQVASDDGLNPGAQLQITVLGSPRAQASVRIRGVQQPVVLRETERGVYTGSYTIRRGDRIDPAAPVRATLRHGNRTATAAYNFPADMGPNVARAPQPPQPPAAGGPRIERFTVATLDKIEPGAELRFTLHGVPGGVADFDIPGVAANVPMRELRPGVYEGTYTIRRMDNLQPSKPIVATLRVGNLASNTTLTQPLITDARPPVIRNLFPREGEAVLDRNANSVSGTFDDLGGVGVDPRSVRITLSGRNITQESQVTPQSFTFRGQLPPGKHTVDVTASDLAGNAVRRSWSFDVVSAASATPAAVTLQVVSHANNAQIGNGPTQVQGRTAPGAMVDVKVSAVAPIVGLFGVTQQVLAQRVQADASGNFAFSFTPQYPIPGTRYEVTMTSHKADLVAESTLVLFQRQG